VNDNDVQHYSNKRTGFPSNYICTTKYSVWNFLPLSFGQQFKQMANVYFLIMAVLQSIPSISPLSPFTAIVPLVFVVCISMTREGIEDYFRNKADKEANGTPTQVLRDGVFIPVRADEI